MAACSCPSHCSLSFPHWQKAQDYGYDQSLIGRLCRNLEEQVQQSVIQELPVVQLTTQYRMHPDICLFPSNYIYGRTLKTARCVLPLGENLSYYAPSFFFLST